MSRPTVSANSLVLVDWRALAGRRANTDVSILGGAINMLTFL
jgi:hypothetical protein